MRSEQGRGQHAQSLVLWVIALTLFLALAFRLWPAVSGMPALAQFFVTEDGYLMLTVARNLAIGLGLSVSDGTIATNGVQPLATLIYAIPYVITGGDKVASLYFLHVIWATIAAAAALAVRNLAARILGPIGLSPVWAWLTAALWFSGPLLASHSMNGLETGLCTLMILLACLQFMRVVDRGAAVEATDLLLMAVLLGLVFLARNDGIFLIFSLLCAWVFHAGYTLRLGVATLLRMMLVPAVVCLALIAPWLIHNKVLFGSIVPISGTAQSMSVAFGFNAALLPSVLFEHLFPMFPIPNDLQTMLPVIVVTGLSTIVVVALFLWRSWQVGGAVRLVVFAYAFHAIAVSFYYGFFFGAPHFLARYTAPLAPLLIMALVSFGWDVSRRFGGKHAETSMVAMSLGAMLLSLALLGRLLVPGANVQGHFQVVEWVDRNVSDDNWVGAVQTGTLGYWHDRTINLDGKVNPDALQARRERGNVLDYVVASEISYLADWVGIANWVEQGGFGEHFEVVVEDRSSNLSVLRRR